MNNPIKYNVEWVKTQLPEFIFFYGHHSSNNMVTKACLRQWWPCKFKSDNIEYISAEQYMMAEKAKLFNDMNAYQLILQKEHPGDIKKLGRQIKNFNEEIWNKNKINIVVKGNILKFSQNEELKNFLIGTGDKVLVEASPHDQIWGIGMYAKDPNVTNPVKWRGQNLLGFSLMHVRDIIKNK